MRSINNAGPVLVHSDAFNTRLLVPSSESKTEMLTCHVSVISGIAAGNEIWMPEFNYTFPKTRVFQPQNDRSEVGPISEFFRKKIASWRTSIPIFSFSGTGEKPKVSALQNTVINPFGPDSVFARLDELNGSILWYGAPFSSSTIIHYIEDIFGPPLYRYDKTFTGVIEISGQGVLDVSVKNHVRPMGMNLDYDFLRLQKDLVREGIIQTLNFDQTPNVCFANASDLVSYWGQKYTEDPYDFLDNKSKKWVEPKVQLLGRRFEIADFEKSETEIF